MISCAMQEYYNKIIIFLEYIFESSRRFKFQLNIIRDIKSVYYNSFLNYSRRDFQDMLFFENFVFFSIYLVSFRDKTRISFRQNAFHSEEKGTFQLDLASRIRRRECETRELRGALRKIQHGNHLVAIIRINILEYTISC